MGVFGSGITQQDRKIFQQGLIASTIRGPHSTGIGYVGRGKGGFIQSFLKAAVSAPELIYSKEYDEFDRLWSDPHVMMGHTRWATQGFVTGENAHPFRHGKVMLMHNGTVHNKDYVSQPEAFEVDSEAVAYSLDKRGVEETLRRVSGAYTLTWYDSEKRTFNAIRNSARPLYVAKAKNKAVWYYASEDEMLYWILGRNNTQIEDIGQLAVDTQLVWNRGQPAMKGQTSVKESIEFHKIKVDNWASGRWASNDNDDYASGGVWMGQTSSHRAPKGPVQSTTVATATTPAVSTQNASVGASTASTTQTQAIPFVGREVISLTKKTTSLADARIKREIKDRFCEQHTVEIGQMISFWLGEYHDWPHSASRNGFALGSLLGSDAPSDVLVKAYCVGPNDFRSSKGNFKTGEYKGKITSIYYEDGPGKIMLGISELSEYVPDKDEKYVVRIVKKPAKEEVKEESQSKKMMFGPKGLITFLEFGSLTENGCMMCTTNINFTDHDKISWNENPSTKLISPICPVCTKELKSEPASKLFADKLEPRVH